MIFPDWTDASAYHFLRHRPAPCWAFEFLRRNPAYTAAYEEWRTIRDKIRARPGSSHWVRQEDFIEQPPRLEGETIQSWEARVRDSGQTPIRTWYGQFYADQFGLHMSLIDPSEPVGYAPLFKLAVRFPLFPGWEEIGEFFEGEFPDTEHALPMGQTPRYCTAVFDLGRPLTSQLQSAEKFMKARQKRELTAGLYVKSGHKKPRLSKPDLLLLLRMLDAKAAGANNSKIAAILFPKKNDGAEYGYQANKFVDKKLKTAIRYRDVDYLHIASSTLTSKKFAGK